MADGKINAVITFSNDQGMDVQSTVQQIEDAIGAITVPNIIPVIRVVDAGGREVRINVNHIREIRECDRTLAVIPEPVVSSGAP